MIKRKKEKSKINLHKFNGACLSTIIIKFYRWSTNNTFISTNTTGLFDQYQIKFHAHAHTPIVEIFKDKVLTVDNMGKKIFTEADTIISAIGRISVKNKNSSSFSW